MKKDVLYLGSQSRTRQKLLDLAQIEYKILEHGSDEVVENKFRNFNEYVLAIAAHKMQTLILPKKSQVNADYLYALTADTLIRSAESNAILGKPANKDEAIKMLTLERQAAVEVVTGCCLEKFYYHNDQWRQRESINWTSAALVEFIVDENSLDQYFANFPFVLQCAGAGMIEDHGLSYLKSINGSYTAVLGLPLYELRQELKKMGFCF